MTRITYCVWAWLRRNSFRNHTHCKGPGPVSVISCWHSQEVLRALKAQTRSSWLYAGKMTNLPGWVGVGAVGNGVKWSLKKRRKWTKIVRNQGHTQGVRVCCPTLFAEYMSQTLKGPKFLGCGWRAGHSDRGWKEILWYFSLDLSYVCPFLSIYTAPCQHSPWLHQ